MATSANRSTQPDERSVRLMRVLALLASAPEPVVSSELASSSGLAAPLELAASQNSLVRSVSSIRDDAESLVVEFDDAYTAYVEGFEQLPSESQMIALQAVDTKLAAMVRAKDAALWTDRARREDPIWSEVRELAADAIEEFAWPETLDGAPIH
jgi:hypothetical protein